jgi:acetyltransferase-like isoleucine patch superfamily enzyme
VANILYENWALSQWRRFIVAQVTRDVTKTLNYFQGQCPVSVGRFTYGIDMMTVFSWGEGTSLTFGSFCSIANGLRVYIGGNHRTDWVSTFPFGHIFKPHLTDVKVPGHPSSKGNIVVQNDVWIGAAATIMSGVTVGNGAVIAANSHVVKDVQPYEIVGGNPAKHISFRFPEPIIARLQELCWWDQPLEVIKKMIPLLMTTITDDLLDALFQLKGGTQQSGMNVRPDASHGIAPAHVAAIEALLSKMAQQSPLK